MEAHFFDINSLIEFESKVWIVSKTNPKTPLIKIEIHEYKMIKSGIYSKYDNKQIFGNEEYFINDKLHDEIRVKCVKNNININDLYFSHAEFTDKSIPKKYRLIDNYDFLANSGTDIYILCSRNTQENYGVAIGSILKYFADLGLEVINIYNLTESFHNRDKDSISHKKAMVVLQHLLGWKIKNNEMLSKIREYDKISYYDDSIKAIENLNNLNTFLNSINDIETVDVSNKSITSILTNSNKSNPFSKTTTNLKLDKIKKFK